MSKRQPPTGKRPGGTTKRDGLDGAGQDGKGIRAKAAFEGTFLQTRDPQPERPGNDQKQQPKPQGTKNHRQLKPPSEQRAQAREEAKRRVRALRRQGERGLARRLEECRKDLRCGSGACPTCVVRLQHQLGRALRERLQTKEQGSQIVTVTVVPPDDAIPQHLLHCRDHLNEMRVWKRRITNTNLEWAVGGVDFSCNENRDGEREPKWAPHLYLIGATSDIEELRRQLKKLFPAQPGFLRPVKVKLWDGRRNALQYLLKENFKRRVSYRGERFDPRRGKMAACRKTSGQRLRADQKTELLRHLDQIGLARRIFSLRAQVHREGERISIRRM